MTHHSPDFNDYCKELFMLICQNLVDGESANSYHPTEKRSTSTVNTKSKFWKMNITEDSKSK